MSGHSKQTSNRDSILDPFAQIHQNMTIFPSRHAATASPAAGEAFESLVNGSDSMPAPDQ